jgi:hypothetical protein
MKRRPDALLALNPDLAPVPLHDSFDNREAHALTSRAFRVKPLKHLKDTTLGARWDSRSVVANPVVTARVSPFSADLDQPGSARLQIVDCIADQIREHLTDSRGVARRVRQGVDGNFRTSQVNRLLQRIQRRADQRADVDVFRTVLLSSAARERKESVNQTLELRGTCADITQRAGNILLEDRTNRPVHVPSGGRRVELLL